MYNLLKPFFLFFIILISYSSQCQTFNLKWNSNLPIYKAINNSKKIKLLGFENCHYDTKDGHVFPILYYSIPNKVEITELKINKKTRIDLPSQAKSIIPSKGYSISNISSNGKWTSNIIINPFLIENNIIYRIDEFELITKPLKTENKLLKKRTYKSNSILAQGNWKKLEIKETGIYKIDYDLAIKMGYSGSIQINNIKVYTNNGGILPEIINTEKVDDLEETPVKVEDKNGNQIFDKEDFILFYAHGPDDITAQNGKINYINNAYTDLCYVFINAEGNASKKMNNLNANETLNATNNLNYYYKIIHHGEENTNVINSGRRWVGDVMHLNTIKTLKFSNPESIGTDTVFIEGTFITQSSENSLINIICNGQNLYNVSNNREITELFSYGLDFENGTDRAREIYFNAYLITNGGNLDFQITYNKPNFDSKMWIESFNITCKNKIMPNGQQMILPKNSIQNLNTQYIIDNNNVSETMVFDITDFKQISLQQTTLDNNKLIFKTANTINNSYIITSLQHIYLPKFAGEVKNQNLHALNPKDYIIIHPKEFKNEAERLAKFHESESQLSYLLVTPEEIYNEFSGGYQDITAIRDFIKMLYDRGNGTQTIKNLLLFGDASYDYKNRIPENTNIIPSYISNDITSVINSYISDDYFVILEDNEGYWGVSSKDEGLDLGVGRIPAKDVYEAELYVNKVINYKSAKSKGDWNNLITLLADDEDENDHFIQSETVSEIVNYESPITNINKIYMDAYKQQSAGNGNSYPDVNLSIDKTLEKGTLIFNYLGHGGESGMAHERVVTRPMINAWKNYNKLAFFITATCELSRFDNPKEDSPGELMIFNPNGGAIGMLTTTRGVFLGINSILNQNLYDKNLFVKTANGYPKIGEAYSKCKNLTLMNNINPRNFVLLCDPALKLNIPEKSINLTKINQKLISNFKDTIKALMPLNIEGQVLELDGQLSTNFNGEINLVVYDKPQTISTLANDIGIRGSYKAAFKVQNNVLFRGKAQVTNGIFNISFIVPKDIDYSYGFGKISMFANTNNNLSAGGNYDSILVGGSSKILANDNLGPKIEGFLEDESFIKNGIVNPNPLLIVKLFDENGINTAGSGIGREIIAKITYPDKSEKTFILNDFYSTKPNDYTNGEIKYQLNNLPSGQYSIIIKAYDVYNNSGEYITEFQVSDEQGLVVKNILNYPNPFINKTTFWFDHNKSGQNLKLSLQIMTLKGQIIKRFEDEIQNANAHVELFEWNGEDDYGKKVGQGIYLYKWDIKSEDGNRKEVIEKLYILK